MGPCNWPLSYASCSSSRCDAFESLSQEDRDRVEAMAVEFLWRWTARVFGVCSVTISPCRSRVPIAHSSTFFGRGPFPGSSGWRWQPVLVAGAWLNVLCGSCGDTCLCDGPNVIALPGPVNDIEEVVIGGEVLDPALYHVEDHRLLVRDDGLPWPVDGWTVTYGMGTPVPEGGQIAAGVLACELALALCGDKSCALPQRVQSITRQGVTIAVLDQFEDVEKGRTGIWLIDSWVASITKSPRDGATRVRSVDLPASRPRGERRVTWPAI